MSNFRKRNLTYIILVASFVILSLVMNVTAVISVPLIQGVEWLGAVKLDGTILKNIDITWAVPLAALMMVVADLLSENFTKKETVMAIILGYAGGLLLSVWLLIGQALVGSYASNNFGLVVDGSIVAHFYPWDALGQSWRFLLAGFIAYVGANTVNTGLMWHFKSKHGEEKLWFRIIISTLFGQIVDNFLFVGIAFMPLGISPLEKSWIEIFWQTTASTTLELGIEIVVSPLTVLLSRRISKFTNINTLMMINVKDGLL